MMMNLRGLVFDDPNGTASLKLPTIAFHIAEMTSNEPIAETGPREDI